MGPSSTDDATPRYEVTVEPAAQAPALTITPKQLGLAALALVLAVLYPYGFGAPIVLPALFVWLGFRIGIKRPQPRGYTVRFFDDVLEISGDGYVGRTEWEHVTDVKESEAGVGIEMPGGRRIDIPKAMLPADRRVLIDALPAHVRFEVVKPAPRPEPSRIKTVGLWLVLIAIVYAIYQVLQGS